MNKKVILRIFYTLVNRFKEMKSSFLSSHKLTKQNENTKTN